MLGRKIVALLLLSIFSSIAVHNAVKVIDYAINYEQISEELCINKDTDITQCNGLCYLNDQVVEVEPDVNNFDYSQVRIHLNFLFYFFEETATSKLTFYNLKPNFAAINGTLFKGFFDVIVPPPSLA